MNTTERLEYLDRAITRLILWEQHHADNWTLSESNAWRTEWYKLIQTRSEEYRKTA